MKFSRAFGLNRAQAALDFVDIDPDVDLPLYIDPYVFEAQNDPFATKCNQAIVSFFRTVLDRVQAGDTAGGRSLLGRLNEPNEICFGVSSDEPDGRGIGQGQAEEIYDQLAASAAARTGMLSDLAKCELFVKGIGPDKISDICANIIRNELVTYTQAQCELLGIELNGEYPIGPTWDQDELRWTEQFHRLPLIEQKPVVLIPKHYVRWRGDLSHQHKQYYDHYVLNYLQNSHLQANDSLVTLLKNGDRKVYKTDLKAVPEYKLSKDFLFRFSRDNPAVLDKYVGANSSKKPPASQSLDESFDEDSFVEMLISELRNLPPGDEAATRYEKLIVYILEYALSPNLTYPKPQARIHAGRKRIDVLYTNSSTDGFFKRISQRNQIPSTYIAVECKNYSSDPANPELDQMIGRFDINRGKIGFICARNFKNRALFVRRCNDTAKAGNGWIIPLVDDDLVQILSWCKEQTRSRIDAKLDELLFEILA